MLGFKVINKDNYYYTFLSEDNQNYELMIEFYGIDADVDDVVLFNEILLDRNSESFCQPYAFELTNSQDYIDNGEFMALRKNGINYILKRVYG